MTPLEVGSDLAASVRLPAHFCGVYALKPTEHRIPLTGFFRLPFPSPRSVRIMATAGPMARDLGDLELALSILAGPDGHDTEVPAVPFVPSPRQPPAGMRLAASPDFPGVTIAKSVRDQVARVAKEAASAGAHVEHRLPSLDWSAAQSLAQDLVTTITGLFAPDARLRDEQRTLAWYFGALAQRDALITRLEQYFEDVDALVLPAATTNAFPHTETGASIDVDGTPTVYWSIVAPMVFCNLTGLPSLVVPAGIADGLPIGIQIIGPRWSEARLLAIAGALEQAGILPGFRFPK
jgi:amidase